MNLSTYPCPCGAGSYPDCCQPFHQGAVPQTPEQLMRSRYSAFVLCLWDYLIKTHHPDHLRRLDAAALSEGPHPKWLALQVHQSAVSGDSGVVFFTAWFKESATATSLDAICERSSFVRQDGKWFYTEGVHQKAKWPGRNDSCVCGSGKKFKHCCLKAG